MRYWIPLAILLIATPAHAVQRFLRDLAGNSSCAEATNESLETTRGVFDTFIDLPDDTADVSFTGYDMAGVTLDGDWDCQMYVTVGTGGGPGNRITVTMERVDSSCAVQETIFTEESPNLDKSASTDWSCTAVTSKSVTFAAGEGIKWTVYQSNGSQSVWLHYNRSFGPRDSDIRIPVIPTGAANKILIIN